MSLSEAADAILNGDDGKHDGRGGGSNFDTSPGAVAKNLLGKFTMRKASILSVSSVGSSPGYGEKKCFSSLEELDPNRHFKSKILERCILYRAGAGVDGGLQNTQIFYESVNSNFFDFVYLC
jgi:hypothetical protein